jgi:uncharacterized HhH-GPD family protein
LALTGDTTADALLDRDPFALLIGMLLDQQTPMERAFAGPQRLLDRMGGDRLDPAAIAAAEPETFAALAAQPPAVHRFPTSMAGRIQAVAAAVVRDYDGDAAALWRDAASGADLRKRLEALPGFGQQKAQIFVALLGKQLGVTPRGWRAAAGPYGKARSRLSVADVVDAATLQEVRAAKQEAKRGRGA